MARVVTGTTSIRGYGLSGYGHFPATEYTRGSITLSSQLLVAGVMRPAALQGFDVTDDVAGASAEVFAMTLSWQSPYGGVIYLILGIRCTTVLPSCTSEQIVRTSVKFPNEASRSVGYFPHSAPNLVHNSLVCSKSRVGV